MKSIIRIIFLCMTTAISTVQSLAQYVGFDDIDDNHFMFNVEAGINSDGYEAELGISWMPVPSFGIKLAIGIAGEMEEMRFWDDYYYDYDYYYDNYYYYDDYYYDDYAVRFKLMPSLVLRSPEIFNLDDLETTFHLFANPGICLSPGASGSRNADWFSWQIKGGIEALISNCVVVGLGYGYSNFNLYSGNPVSHYESPEKPKRNTHTVFLNLGIMF